MKTREAGPMLFVDSPPIHFISEPVYSKVWHGAEEEVEEPQAEGLPVKADAVDGKLDESTSVYTLPGRAEETEKILAQLRFLTRPFQRQAYRPIQFRLKGGGAVTGDIERMEDGKIHIRNAVEEGDVREIPIKELEAIWWKGKPFPR
ncbi:hypothetical protein ACFFIY_08195 [Bhargavaea ullalensis]|uniref:Uncharacterized protein n=1 Tax=Bhargavaea ullalensis TaxID=1265685 RepID=A0ABV2GCB4_9BACL